MRVDEEAARCNKTKILGVYQHLYRTGHFPWFKWSTPGLSSAQRVGPTKGIVPAATLHFSGRPEPGDTNRN